MSDLDSEGRLGIESPQSAALALEGEPKNLLS